MLIHVYLFFFVFNCSFLKILVGHILRNSYLCMYSGPGFEEPQPPGGDDGVEAPPSLYREGRPDYDDYDYDRYNTLHYEYDYPNGGDGGDGGNQDYSDQSEGFGVQEEPLNYDDRGPEVQ